MAIPFQQPDDDESVHHHGNGAASSGNGSGGSGTNSSSGAGGGSTVAAGGGGGVGSSSSAVGAAHPNTPAPSGSSTAPQTPLIGPINSDQLVQLFYEALFHYTRLDTPSSPISPSPQSVPCSPFTPGYYNRQVFFPQTPGGTQRAAGGGDRGPVFFGPPTPSPSGSSSHSSAANSPDTPSCYSTLPFFHQFPSSFPGTSSGSAPITPATASATATRITWNDDGDESSESDSSSQATTASPGCSPHCLGHHHHHHHHHQLHQLNDGGTMGLMPASGFIPPHLDYMAGREQLQEFAGKIPQRKKKPKANNKLNKPKKSRFRFRFLEKLLSWQTTIAVTATLFALGLGYFMAS